MHHEKHVGEACPEIGPIRMVVSEIERMKSIICYNFHKAYLEDLGVYTSIHLGQ